jgi:hypothetical protein
MQTSSDDEFESPLVAPKSKKTAKTVSTTRDSWNRKKHPSAARAFIEAEADLSDDCLDSGDEDEDDLDCLEGSFINDETQMSQSQHGQFLLLFILLTLVIIMSFKGFRDLLSYIQFNKEAPYFILMSRPSIPGQLLPFRQTPQWLHLSAFSTFPQSHCYLLISDRGLHWQLVQILLYFRLA